MGRRRLAGDPRPQLAREGRSQWREKPAAGLTARAARGVTSIQLDVASVVGARRHAKSTVAATAARVGTALGRSDVLLYTSREVISGRGQGGLDIARAVSAGLSAIVGQVLPARPAWVIAKGGITAHDVAVHGLGMRRAEVAGQLFPGLISVFRPVDAAADAIGMPYVVFPGNVGDHEALAQAAAMLSSGAGNLG